MVKFHPYSLQFSHLPFSFPKISPDSSLNYSIFTLLSDKESSGICVETLYYGWEQTGSFWLPQPRRDLTEITSPSPIEHNNLQMSRFSSLKIEQMLTSNYNIFFKKRGSLGTTRSKFYRKQLSIFYIMI